jgi:penicillin-binding protein 1B
VGLVLGTTFFVVYSWYTFREIEKLMGQTPSSQPTLLYSDVFKLSKGDDFANSHLLERLRQLNIDLKTESSSDGSSTLVRWTARTFTHPAVLLEDVPGHVPNGGSRVVVTVSDGVVSSILENDEEIETIILEPLMIAQFAGAYTAIRDYVPLEQIPTVLKEAIISIEDQRFREHPGFDLKSLARALWVNLRSGSISQGGSTITQQLVKNLALSNRRTIWRKIRELILAVLIEFRYDKEKILEKYLNEVYFGQIGALEIHGVSDAARYFFNKPLDGLSQAEMALLAGLIRGPAYYSPYRHLDRALARKDTVLKKLAEQHYIAEEELNAALSEKILLAPPTHGKNIAPYFADYIKAAVIEQLADRISQDDLGAEGLRIYTTMDPVLQSLAEQSTKESIIELEKNLKIPATLRLEGLLVVADHHLGFIRAIVGGRSYAETTFNRVLNMKRQAGSTFKPFVYLAAFAKGQDQNGEAYTPSYLILDEPFELTYGGKQKWAPQNYDRSFKGSITLREALIHSINVPAAKVAIDVGIDQVIDTIKKLGVSSDLLEVPSISLGSVDVASLELLQAYSTIANRGQRIDLTAIKLITDKEGSPIARHQTVVQTIYEPGLFELIDSLLLDVTRSGTAKAMGSLGYKKPAHGKTGTTSHYRDSWFAGYSQGLSAVSWVGFDELKNAEDNKIKLTGASAALPLWARYFRKARPSPHTVEDPPYEVVTELPIDFTKNCKATLQTPKEHEKIELYLPGTAPEECLY